MGGGLGATSLYTLNNIVCKQLFKASVLGFVLRLVAFLF